MFHGRDPYSDPHRLLWRCWLWTTASRGLPDVPIEGAALDARKPPGTGGSGRARRGGGCGIQRQETEEKGAEAKVKFQNVSHDLKGKLNI